MKEGIMECPGNPLMQEDMNSIAVECGYFQKFSNKTVLITGATGLIGSQAAKAMCALNRVHQTNIRVLCLVRSKEKGEKVFGDLLERGDLILIEGDVTDSSLAEKLNKESINFIIHGAAPTSSKFFVEKPVETIDTVVFGTKNVLELAKQHPLESMVFLSSLEVYGTPGSGQEWMREEDFGTLDPAKERSSYSEGKRMAECLCVSYAFEYGVPVCIARLSQTFGPGVEYGDGRVFMDFARHAIEGEDVVLHTEGRTVRTYLYTADAVSSILLLLAKGEPKCAYNVTNKDTAISIYDMAKLVCETVGKGEVSVRKEIPEDVASFGYNPEMVIRLDTSKLESLGWSAKTGLSEMFERMVKSF